MTGKPSIDRPWLKFYPEGADNIQFPEMTAYQFLYERTKEEMGGIALEYYGAKISRAAFFRKIDETAKALTAFGVKSGDVVTVMLPNIPEAVYCLYALNKIGACANMLGPIYESKHIAESIDFTESKIIVILDQFYNTLDREIEKTKTEKIVIVSPFISLPAVLRMAAVLKEKLKVKSPAIPRSDRCIGWKGFIKTGQKQKDVLQAPYQKDTPAVIVYSSGSTGANKGIVLANEALVNLTVQGEAQNGLNCQNLQLKKSCVIVPMFISTGLNLVLGFALNFKVTADLVPQYESGVFVKNVIKNHPDVVIATTGLFESFVDLDDNLDDNIDLSKLIFALTGGESLPIDLENRLNQFFERHNSKARMLQGWGMCEFGSVVTTTEWDNPESKGVGKPMAKTIIGIFDLDTDEELGYNERGEIRVITPCRMLGYYKNPEATAAFFRKGKDGQIWGCSGDMGYMDEDGNVFVEGRANDYIPGKNGNKFWLFDIEKIILADEAVQFCAAVGFSADDRHIPAAHLVLKQDCTEKPEEVIRRVHESCVKSLLSEAVPRRYKIRGRFNVLPSGKRDTRSLKDERDGFYEVEGDEVKEVEV